MMRIGRKRFDVGKYHKSPRVCRDRRGRRVFTALGAAGLAPAARKHKRNHRETNRESFMLKLVPPLIGPELLMYLRAMGHGDEIAIVDANYPADSNAERLVRLDGIPVTDVLDAVLTLMPLDPPEFSADAAIVMDPASAPGSDQPIYAEFRKVIARHEGEVPLTRLERFAFYARAKTAYAIVATGERRLYGNIILKKGVIRPD
jgi:L-fucose mutarotase